MIHDPARHHEFVMLFEIKNPSPQSLSWLEHPLALAQDVRYGLVTGKALKQKLNQYLKRQFALPVLKMPQPIAPDSSYQAGNALCQQYYGLRMFGVVNPEGQKLIPGPVQFSWARSIDPVLPLVSQNTAYGLYRTHGYYDPSLGKLTGVAASDLTLVWHGLSNFFQPKPSLHPMTTAARGLWIFSHQTAGVSRKEVFGLIKTPALGERAKKFEDYTIHFPTPGSLEALSGVTLTHLA